MNSGNRSRKKVGIVGWRGMVGSVLMQRMKEEGDLVRNGVEYFLFSTSQSGKESPISLIPGKIYDARDTEKLASMDCLVSCQGSAYTDEIHPQLRHQGWHGCWIDAASSLRLAPSSTLILDIINRDLIIDRLHKGCRDFIGANCTVSLMMIAIWPLLRDRLIEWIFATTYQSASGAGAAGISDLLQQMSRASAVTEQQAHTESLEHPVLLRAHEVDRSLQEEHGDDSAFAAPLCANVIAWIDAFMADSGQSREEWKAEVECNTIMNLHGADQVRIEGVCVRVPVLRCHSQSLLMHLRQDLSVEDVRSRLSDNPWVEMIDNTPQETARNLHPLATSGGLKIKVGRLRKTFSGTQPGSFLQLFTVGDQLLWGAAEPLRRMIQCWLEED